MYVLNMVTLISKYVMSKNWKIIIFFFSRCQRWEIMDNNLNTWHQ